MTAAASGAASMSRSRRVPEWAMVPRHSSRAPASMPMPLSETVSVRAAASKLTSMTPAASGSPASARAMRALSRASEALEMSSRRNTS